LPLNCTPTNCVVPAPSSEANQERIASTEKK
jgi:hypothetical protein